MHNTINRKQRVLGSVLVMAALAGFLWVNDWFAFGGRSERDGFGWFEMLVMGLTAVNLLNWILESGPSAETGRCIACGRERMLNPPLRCDCGKLEFGMPWLNRIALALVVVLLGGLGLRFLFALCSEPEVRGNVKGWVITILLIFLAVLVAIMGSGVRLPQFLDTDALADFRAETQRLRLQRNLAVRVILLVSSVAVVIGATWFRLKNT